MYPPICEGASVSMPCARMRNRALVLRLELKSGTHKDVHASKKNPSRIDTCLSLRLHELSRVSSLRRRRDRRRKGNRHDTYFVKNARLNPLDQSVGQLGPNASLV